MKSPKTSRKTLQTGELVQIPNLEKEDSLRKLKRKEESYKRLNNKDKIDPPASPGALKKKSPKTRRKTLQNDELVHQLDIPASPASPVSLKHKKKSPPTSRKTMHNDELVHQLDISDMKKQEKWRKQKIKYESTKNLTVRDKSIVPPSPRPLKEKKSPRGGRKSLAVDPEGHTGMCAPFDERELIARNLQKEESSTRLDAKDNSARLRFRSLADLGDDAPESRSPLRKKRYPRVSSRKTLIVVEHNGMAQLVMSFEKEDDSRKIKSQGKVHESTLKPNIPQID
jgi:hypothetical protein